MESKNCKQMAVGLVQNPSIHPTETGTANGWRDVFGLMRHTNQRIVEIVCSLPSRESISEDCDDIMLIHCNGLGGHINKTKGLLRTEADTRNGELE